MCVNSQDVAGHSWGAKEKATFVMRTPSILLLRVIPHKWQICHFQLWRRAFLFYYWFIFAQITFKHLCGYSEFLMPRSSVVLTQRMLPPGFAFGEGAAGASLVFRTQTSWDGDKSGFAVKSTLSRLLQDIIDQHQSPRKHFWHQDRNGKKRENNLLTNVKKSVCLLA